MKQIAQFFSIILVLALVIVGYNSIYTVRETEQVILTQFGEVVGDPVLESGLHFKMPFVQKPNYMEKRILDWDGRTTEMTTKDKTFIEVDTFGRWRIVDPKQFFLRLRDERSAISRLDGILGSATKEAIAKHELVEVVRSTKGREPQVDASLNAESSSLGVLPDIVKGRVAVEEEIFQEAAKKLTELGIELLDVRFKRVNYHDSVERSIYQRMISERQQIAERFRSEGAGEAAKINGKRGRDLQEIESVAYRRVLEIRGDADAKATQIYADAYNQSQEAIKFYEFIKSLEAYESVLKGDTTLILTTESELFKYLKNID
ncbi:protease modulator HflC [Pelagicoccus sp. NFK12]|uniref:Protein HflC n=1 Tax=Pelagicoccus enzymogenes TaxID=2773457 RepID=A0A927IH45_9BACT|nr:protease modulator HflC [Pelagicoccus enzymogenes]MBD5781872.1 protease modulator HflC [Pelagicoccus enzymogenes]MDQ8196627.1 protease modulator HflC [Pelagicoccus enzymogenes]